MKTKIIVFICAAIGIALSSCNKFLDVKPEDRFLEEDVFRDELSVNNALNGIYINLVKTNLYGGNLTMGTVDVLAQYYNHNSTWLPYVTYKYQDKDVKDRFSSIWDASYLAILNTNNFIRQLDKTKGVVSDERKNLLMGEAYAIRAFVHFDLLRLFGPVYESGADKLSIPYMSVPTEKIQPLLPAKVVADSVLMDLKRAEDLLINDPVRANGVVNVSGTDAIADFDKLRNRRLNFYAVIALKARVLLYMGNKSGALTAAEQVITESTKWFPWTAPEQTLPGIANPDRNFSSEILFGLLNMQMYNQQRNLFASVLDGSTILAPTTQRLNEVFENNLNDYRSRINWVAGTSAGKAYRTFVKFEDVIDKKMMFRNFQPLIRMSEMYYIAAECSADRTTSLNYINTIRTNRGIPNVTSNTVAINDVLRREYRKEFWGEGQMFYYYKRRAISSIPSGVNGTDMPMDDAKYVIPLPDYEIQNRSF